nr:hypothetical protein [Tanacetum cinerariifolium]
MSSGIIDIIFAIVKILSTKRQTGSFPGDMSSGIVARDSRRSSCSTRSSRDTAEVCNTSRWKDNNTPGKKVPKKVLSYILIIPRLQHLYKSSHTAKEMIWHDTGKCTTPGKMQHPVDGRAWKNFDTKYPDFAKEPRNVRLGLVVDGFNPFGNLSQAYSMWPVILTTYNLPSWLCMKESSFMLTLLIPGPKSLGKDIDSIIDFPAQSSLSWWSRQGYKACPTCNKDTLSVRVLSKTAYVCHIRFLKKPRKWRSSHEFNGQTDNRDPPKEFGWDEILAQLDRLPTRLTGKHPSYGGLKIKRNVLQICSATLMEDDMLKAQVMVVDILCNLELIYPPSLFDIMIHLVIHLPLEALEGGPIRPRWMFPFERNMKKLKGYVRNKAKPEDKDKDPKVSTTNELFALACGPTWTTISINSYVVDGVRYVVHSRDERHTTQNSDICSPGPDGEMYYGRKVKRLVFRNNITQIDTRGEAFKNDQYILVTQVKQVFYLEDKAKPHLKVVEHVNHKKFSDGGVIVVEEDPDIIHFDNLSDLLLSTSLNDLDNATLHIDGQLTEVDAPSDIIDVVDEDDDIIDDEDAIPYDLADTNNEDLINVDDDDVARSYGSDGEDRPPPHHVPTGYTGCFANQGKGKQKPNLGGRAAGRLHTRDKTRNLSLKEITDKKGPVSIRFEVRDKQTLMPLDDHAAHWSSYIGEVIRGVPLYYPSWLKVLKEQKAALITDIGRQSSTTQENPSLIDTFFVVHTVNGVFTRDEDRLIYEMRRLEATGTYTDDEINRLARRSKQRWNIPGVSRVLPARVTAGPSRPAPESTLKSLHKKVDFMMSLFKSDSKFSDAFSQFESAGTSESGGSDGCGDDEESADDQEDEDEDGDDDS